MAGARDWDGDDDAGKRSEGGERIERSNKEMSTKNEKKAE